MSNVTHGADPAQLSALGSQLKAQLETIDGILALGTTVTTTPWMGPAREAFVGQWETSFKLSLDNLKLAFETAGNECTTRAAGLESVMGGASVGGSAGGGPLPV